MSWASWGSLISAQGLARAAKRSRQRMPDWASCCPVATALRSKPKRRSAARGPPWQRVSATSAWKSRRACPLSRRAAERINFSYTSVELPMDCPPRGWRDFYERLPSLANHSWVVFRTPDALTEERGEIAPHGRQCNDLPHKAWFEVRIGLVFTRTRLLK